MSEPPRRIVFAANVWVSAALLEQSVPAQAISAARAGRVRSVASEQLIGQIRRALLRLGFDPEPLRIFVNDMRACSDVVAPTTTLAVITAKESDNRILELAVDGHVDLIVTGDRKHLLPLGAYAGIPIVSPADFVASLATKP